MGGWGEKLSSTEAAELNTWKALLSQACPGAAGMQAVGRKEEEGKLVGAKLPAGIQHHKSVLPVSPLP